MTKKHLLFLSLVIILFVAAVVGCSSGSQAPAGAQSGGTANPAAPVSSLDGKALAQERCTVCHSFTRIENAKKTPQEWDATVKRMIDHGASLTADEQAAVTAFLSATYK